MALYSLVPKTCRALQAYLRAAAITGLDSANILAHKDDETRTVPNVTIRAESATPKMGNPGAWTVGVKIWVATTMIVSPDATNDPVVDSDDLAAAVFDEFFRGLVGQDNSFLADAITAAARAAVVAGTPTANLADFKCDYIRHVGGVDIQQDPEGHFYLDILPLSLDVRASTAIEP